MTLFTTQEADAYADAEQRDIDCGKALKIDYTTCPCGYNTHCMTQIGGRAWICSDPQCTEKSRFEEERR